MSPVCLELNHGAKPQHHPRCEPLLLPLYLHYQQQTKGQDFFGVFQKTGPDMGPCSLVAPFAHLQEGENMRISMLSAWEENSFRCQSRAVTQGFIPETSPGRLSQICLQRCSDGLLGMRKSRAQLLEGQHAMMSPSLDHLFGRCAGGTSTFPGLLLLKSQPAT